MRIKKFSEHVQPANEDAQQSVELSTASDAAAKQAIADLDKARESIRNLYYALNSEARSYEKSDMLSNGKSAYSVLSGIADSVEGNAFHVVKECGKYLETATRDLTEARKLKLEDTLPFEIIPVSGYHNVKEEARSLLVKIVKELGLKDGSIKYAPQGAADYDEIIEMRFDKNDVYARFDIRGHGDYGKMQVSVNGKDVLYDKFNVKNSPGEGTDGKAYEIKSTKHGEARIKKFVEIVLANIK